MNEFHRDLLFSEITRCERWITDALRHSGGTHDYADIAEGILSGRYQLWTAPDACMVTEIVVHPRKSVLFVFLAGGRLETLLGMHEKVTRWAKGQGCSLAMATGRPGWTRALAGLGGALETQSLLMMEI